MFAKSDCYTKTILTIIAVFLVILTLKEYSITTPAHAQNKAEGIWDVKAGKYGEQSFFAIKFNTDPVAEIDPKLIRVGYVG